MPHPPKLKTNEVKPAQAVASAAICSASVVHCEDIPATIRRLSYAVDDLKAGCREFEEMMDNGEGWQCLSAFQIVNGRFTITLCKPNDQALAQPERNQTPTP